jgi:APA family basic amino acid/polyamine antiporter
MFIVVLSRARNQRMNKLFRKKSILTILEDARLGYGDADHASGLHKVLGVRDLTFFGIAAIIGGRYI